MWGFGGLILEMDKVDFTVRMSFLTTNHEGNQLYSNSHPSAQTPGLSNNIEVVVENIFRLLAFSLANDVLVHIQ